LENLLAGDYGIYVPQAIRSRWRRGPLGPSETGTPRTSVPAVPFMLSSRSVRCQKARWHAVDEAFQMTQRKSAKPGRERVAFAIVRYAQRSLKLLRRQKYSYIWSCEEGSN